MSAVRVGAFWHEDSTRRSSCLKVEWKTHQLNETFPQSKALQDSSQQFKCVGILFSSLQSFAWHHLWYVKAWKQPSSCWNTVRISQVMNMLMGCVREKDVCRLTWRRLGGYRWKSGRGQTVTSWVGFFSLRTVSWFSTPTEGIYIVLRQRRREGLHRRVCVLCACGCVKPKRGCRGSMRQMVMMMMEIWCITVNRWCLGPRPVGEKEQK